MTPNNQTGASWYADPSQGSIPDSFNLFQEQFLKPLGKTAVNIEREKEVPNTARFVLKWTDKPVCFVSPNTRQKKSANLSRFGNAWQCPAKSRRLTTTTALIR